jgi:predicted membrane protein
MPLTTHTHTLINHENPSSLYHFLSFSFVCVAASAAAAAVVAAFTIVALLFSPSFFFVPFFLNLHFFLFLWLFLFFHFSLKKRMHTTIKRGETQLDISVVARSTKETYYRNYSRQIRGRPIWIGSPVRTGAQNRFA